jgi:hypothetical protein
MSDSERTQFWENLKKLSEVIDEDAKINEFEAQGKVLNEK